MENDRQLVTCQLSNCQLILFYFNPFPSPSSSHIGQQHNTAYFVKVAFGNLQSLLQLGRAAIRNSQTRTLLSPPPPTCSATATATPKLLCGIAISIRIHHQQLLFNVVSWQTKRCTFAQIKFSLNRDRAPTPIPTPGLDRTGLCTVEQRPKRSEQLKICKSILLYCTYFLFLFAIP